MTPLATKKEVAEHLRVSTRTVERLPIPLTNDGYRWADVRKYLRSTLTTGQRDHRRNRQSIYVIRAKTMGLLKIGVSTDSEKRMAALSEQAPDELELLCAVKGHRGTEAVLHQRFREHRVRGEWFHPHPEILAWVEAQRA